MSEREKLAVPGTDDAAYRRVSETTDAGAIGILQIEIRERIGIEPLRGGAMRRVERDSGELVGARLAHRGEDVGIGRVDGLLIGREERAGLQDGDAGQLPIADQMR